MKCLLDTCALIYVLFKPEALSTDAAKAINDNNDLYVSIVSLWEMMIKMQIGKLDVAETSAMELKDACDQLNITILQTSVEEIDHVRKLPIFKDHGDPFDRLIISQAQYHHMPVITSDTKFDRYGIEVIW